MKTKLKNTFRLALVSVTRLGDFWATFVDIWRFFLVTLALVEIDNKTGWQ